MPVSVVIPTLDRPAQLQDCLASIARGQWQPAEVIVCDQSRDDRTRRLIERWPGICPRLHYCQLNRPSASAARNRGLELAENDLIAYIDDDCRADAGWLAALVASYEQVSRGEPVAAVAGRVLPLAAAPGRLPVSTRDSTERRIYRRAAGGLERGEWAPWDVGTGGNLLASRRALVAAGGFDESLGPGSAVYAGEDIDLLYRLTALGAVVYEPAALVYHPPVDRRRRLLSRFRYGAGMGALLSKHLRAGEPAARALLLLYLRHQAANTTRRGVWGLPEALLTLAGAGVGGARTYAQAVAGRQSSGQGAPQSGAQ